MAQNINPIFPLVGNIAWATIATANTAKDGTGTVATIFTADGTNGSRLDTIKCRPAGTNIASVVRIFINNGSASSTAGNNTLYLERSLPAITVSEVVEQNDLEIPLNLVLPPGYKINLTIGTTVAAGWAFTGVGGNY